MATDSIKAGIPIISLDSGYQVVFEAIDPTTGAAVGGVRVTNVAVYGDDLAASNTPQTPAILSPSLLPG